MREDGRYQSENSRMSSQSPLTTQNSLLSTSQTDSAVLSRRSFLTGLAGMSLSYGLAGCANQNQPGLNVRVLNRSIPPQILNEFRKSLQQSSQQVALNFTPEPQLQTLFSLLQTWKQKGSSPNSSASGGFPLGGSSTPAVADLVTLGDYWLTKAIQQNLIHPLEPNQIQNWSQLPQTDQWKALVTRNAQGQPDPKGKVWAAPYQWGSMVIAYRSDIFQEKGLQPPTDWQDLWRSDLRGHLSLPDQARTVIGLTLKKLGKSINTANLNSVPSLAAELRALNQQAKLYSTDAYLQPLLLGDTWVAVGWSTDVLPLMQRSQQLAAVVPQSGTALWANLWVRPIGTEASAPNLVNEWISFCWQSQIASQMSLLSRTASPAILTATPTELPIDLRRNHILLPDAAILKNSEFLQPLPDAAINQYRETWQLLRQTV